MSTKVTLFFDDKIHFYQESFDENHVYLKLENDMFSTKLSFSLEEIIGMVNSIDIDLLKKQAALTDEQIKEYVQSTVAARVRSSNAFVHLFGALVYGDASDPVEKQENKGIQYYSQKRDALKKVLEVLENKPRRGSKFMFGLEDII